MVINPLVTVICLCYNQRKWVEEAVDSVLHQSYKNIQFILVDDASTDDSQTVIKRIQKQYPHIRTILLGTNQGNCRAFNTAIQEARGSFIIDFAADDVMAGDRIEKQVGLFAQLDEGYGVIFTDAHYIDSRGSFIRGHYEYLRNKHLLSTVPEGDVYRDVLRRYFIASPTMMIRKKVFDTLNGYDESLAYEDFDFWVRAARYFKFAFLNEPLTLIRRSGNSMSSGLYRQGDRQLYSTYLVCRKAMELNHDNEDRKALVQRLHYELRQAVLSDNHKEVVLFYGFLEELGEAGKADRFWYSINRAGIPMSGLRKIYHSIRFGRLSFS